MASMLKYGAVKIYKKESDILGVGSYGKVCKAKCGRLPCAAKLLHDTIFGTNDPGIRKFVERFEQECQFMSAIKHPNIVQFLGVRREPKSQRLVLLMELMDESLTRFLERSISPLPYHTQLNICQDVTLALAYLHSNDITHRDLSSNNVLLIGEGSRAKVTDFGMSKLEGMNPRMTPLTMCPGTQAYMPPEALISPPQYSSKLDCFSYGVLTIQIATRQFPKPGDAHKYVEDTNYPNERLLRPVPESERRKKDIDLVAPDHPLLPLALHCLKTKVADRPSADELCERLATLKCEPRYTHSVEQQCDTSSLEQRANHAAEVHEYRQQLETMKQLIQEKDDELKRMRCNHEEELHRCRQEKEDELDRCRQEKEDELDRCRQEKEDELERASEQHAKELSRVIADCQAALTAKTTDCEGKQREIEQLRREIEALQTQVLLWKSREQQASAKEMTLEWRLGTPAPEDMTSSFGAGVVHGNTAYFSKGFNVYSYTLPEDKWTTLPPCEYEDTSLAVVNDKLTTVGGRKEFAATNKLFCLSRGLFGMKWKLFSSMPTERVRPAAVTTTTHLVVAGGSTGNYYSSNGLSTIEVLDLNTLQWSSASSSPKALRYPHMTLCGGYLYLSEHNIIFSCSVEELFKSCKPPSTNSSDDGSVWTILTDIPVHWGSLATLRGHILAIGGSGDLYGGNPTGAIHCYDSSTNSWSVIGEMPTPRYRALVAALPSNELIVVGGMRKVDRTNIMEIAILTSKFCV